MGWRSNRGDLSPVGNLVCGTVYSQNVRSYALEGTERKPDKLLELSAISTTLIVLKLTAHELVGTD